MTDWQVVYLGMIAAAMVVMAIIQVVILIQIGKAARQIASTSQEIRTGILPVIVKAQRIADDASRVSALAVAQAERIDRIVTSGAARLGQTLDVVQNAVVEPVRQGAAVIAAVRAALSVFRGPRDGRASKEEEDALFVG